jgi:hypothetical protein
MILSTFKKILSNKFLNFSFSEESLGSTFKIRSKLSDFFKHTHPDILQNAPVL